MSRKTLPYIFFFCQVPCVYMTKVFSTATALHRSFPTRQKTMEVRGDRENACTLRRLKVSNGSPFVTPESGHLRNRATRTINTFHFHSAQICMPWLKLNTGNILTHSCVLLFVFVWTSSLCDEGLYSEGSKSLLPWQNNALVRKDNGRESVLYFSSVFFYGRVAFEDIFYE